MGTGDEVVRPSIILDEFTLGLGNIISQIINFMDGFIINIGFIHFSLWEFAVSSAVFLLIFATIHRIMD